MGRVTVIVVSLNKNDNVRLFGVTKKRRNALFWRFSGILVTKNSLDIVRVLLYNILCILIFASVQRFVG